MEPFVLPQETLDNLPSVGLRIIQPRDGYRFSIDPVLLSDFATCPDNAVVADLGAGNGILPLLLSPRPEINKIVAIERQIKMVERARRSVALNHLSSRIEIVQGDVRNLDSLLPVESFDVVVTNPPYRKQFTGRVAPGDERSAARHELAGGLADFLRAAKYLLKTGGRLHIIYLAEQLSELVVAMRSVSIEPKRMRMIHPRSGEKARLVLLEGRKNGRPGLEVLAPLFIYAGPGRHYSADVLKIYGMQAGASVNEQT